MVIDDSDTSEDEQVKNEVVLEIFYPRIESIHSWK